MSSPSLPRVIAFDGDDTLWPVEDVFASAQERLHALLSRHVTLDRTALDRHLRSIEEQNLVLHGHGLSGFVLSMVQTAIEITDGRIPATDIAAILSLGREMMAQPVTVMEEARNVLHALRARGHELWLVTKGNLFNQESKVARSGLEPLFDAIEIVEVKNEATYRDLLNRHGVAPDQFAMVGDSLRSDVLPVVALGGLAFHVPAKPTWVQEQVEAVLTGDRVQVLGGLSDLLSFATNLLHVAHL